MTDEKKDPKAVLADAIRKRDELNTFIKVYQEMLGMTESPQESVPGALRDGDRSPSGEVDPLSVVFPGMFFGKTQPLAAKTLLEQLKPRPQKTRVIVECLKKGGLELGGKKPAVNLWGVLSRNPDTFILVPKAGWGLVEWYEPSVIAKFRKEGGKGSEESDNGNG